VVNCQKLKVPGLHNFLSGKHSRVPHPHPEPPWTFSLNLLNPSRDGLLWVRLRLTLSFDPGIVDNDNNNNNIVIQLQEFNCRNPKFVVVLIDLLPKIM
jgi:hypothetical protein